METLKEFLARPECQLPTWATPEVLWAIALLMIWVLIWKGLALWKSARLSHKWWFIVLMLVNTLGILEIIYIFFVAKKKSIPMAEPQNMNQM